MSEEPQAEVSTPAQPTAVPDLAWNDAVANWVNDHVRNSPIAGATEAWSHLMGALPRLKTYLENELGKKE